MAVIGAGIVGCSVALVLAAEGHRVTVFDPDHPGSGTTSGNAGAIVTGSVLPNATPEVIRSIPRLLLDRNGPATVRLAHLPRAMPWLWRFLRAGRLAEVERISRALEPLVTNALAAYQPLLKLSGAEGLVSQAGWLKIYTSEREFDAATLERKLQQRAKIEVAVLDRNDLLRLEPSLAPEICHRGLLQPRAGLVADPRALAAAFMRAARQRGAHHCRVCVDHLGTEPDGRIAVHVRGGPASIYDKVVVAAGAWSARLARCIGDKVFLEAERGYHMVFGPGSEHLLDRPVLFPGFGMVLSPMAGGLRLLNGTELAGLDAPPDFRRIRRLTETARRVLPALEGKPAGNEWIGYRPSTPDSLPVIGPSPRSRNVVYAFGHGHLGLTMAARTAEMVRDVIGDDRTASELVAYQIDRFARGASVHSQQIHSVPASA